MKKTFKVIFCALFMAGLAGCNGLPVFQLPVSQVNIPVTQEITQAPADTSTFEPTTTFQFPPTWTPSWIKPSTPVTPHESGTPVISQTPDSKTITPLYPTGLLSIFGSKGQKTSTMPLKAGTITLVWKYSGGNRELDTLTKAKTDHENLLKNLYNSMSQTLVKLNSNLADATNQNNSSQIDYWTEQIKQTKVEYGQEIDQENIHYQTQLATIVTPFSIQINRTSVNKPVTLVTAKGLYLGQASYKAVSAPDYYFIIVASGPYQIDITR